MQTAFAAHLARNLWKRFKDVDNLGNWNSCIELYKFYQIAFGMFRDLQDLSASFPAATLTDWSSADDSLHHFVESDDLKFFCKTDKIYQTFM